MSTAGTHPEDRTITTPQWTLGDRLRKARRHASMEAQDLAQALGVSRNTISNAENDRGPIPKRHFVMAWAIATGVDRFWLETGNTNTQEVDVPQGRASGGRAPRSSTPDVLSGCRTNRVIDLRPYPVGDSTDPCRLPAPTRRRSAVRSRGLQANRPVTRRSAAR